MTTELETLLAPCRALPASTAWQPVLIAAGAPDAAQRLAELVRSGQVAFFSDTADAQLEELLQTRYPSRDLTARELSERVAGHLGGLEPARYGTWVFYPWSRRLVHVLPEAEYRELRTSRNRNKITADEQAQLRALRVGVVGLSVGQSTALTLAMEEIGGELVLADFDSLSLSNMNRLRAGVHEIGVHKALITAREIVELNPYAHIELFQEGITEENLDRFLASPRPLDLLFEECDDFYLKVRLRERARALRIPVIMETSDRGLIDVERFDREPERPLFHGLIEGLDPRRFKSASNEDKVPLAMEIIGGEAISERMAASAVEVGTTLKTWPQLASAVALGGALNADAGRRVALGQLHDSGRFYVDLEKLIADGAGVPVQRTTIGRAVSREAQADLSLPTLRRASGAALSPEQARSLAAYGVMAPSGGNSQPWRLVFERGTLHCHHLPERSKAFLDYEHLASFLAFGGLVENVSLAAEQLGLATRVQLFPERDNPRHVCALSFAPLDRPPRDTHLFEQIARRMTNRKPGTRVALPASVGQALRAEAEAAGGRLLLLDQPGQLDAIADILGPGDRLRFVSKLMHGELMAEIRWTPEEVERTRDGLDVATLELSPLDLTGLRLATSTGAMQLLGRLGGGRALEKPGRKAIAGASAVGLVTFPGGHTPENMFRGGRALQRVWLGVTGQGLVFQPMTALVCLFWRLLGTGEGLSTRERAELERLRRAWLELLDFPRDHGEIMLFRIARADPPTAHSLRRTVEDVFEVAPA